MSGFYHMSIKIGSRSSGKSAVSAAAYRSGSKIKNFETGETVDYTRKSGVIYSEIIIPKYAPIEYMNREVLWNEVQKVENKSNSQLFREFEIAFPCELTQEQQIDAIREFAKHRVAEGMCVDFSIHIPKNKENENPHCHMMCTTRGIIADGENKGSWDIKEKTEYVYEKDKNGNFIPEIDKETGKQKIKIINNKERLQWKRVPIIDPKTGKQKEGKNREKLWLRKKVKANSWNSPNKVEEWRKDWADICNEILDEDHHIDWRSFIRQNIDQAPTIHEGYAAREIEKKGGISERCELNRKIRATNDEMDEIMQAIQEKIKTLNRLIQEAYNELQQRIAKVQEYFARIMRDAAQSESISRYYESAAERDREVKKEERGACKIDTTAEKEIKVEKSENIHDIKKRRELINERIRKLIERRGIGNNSRESARRDRSIQKGNTGEESRNSGTAEQNRGVQEKNTRERSREQEFIKDDIGSKENNEFFKNGKSGKNGRSYLANKQKGREDTGINGECDEFEDDCPRLF